jgi:signal transduction histidine kinase
VLLDCEGVSLFLANERGDRLELAATTGITWLVSGPEQFYRRNEGLTGRVLATGRAMLATDRDRYLRRESRSYEKVSRRLNSRLIAPLVNSRGDVAGVVRCQNKASSAEYHDRYNKFSFQDICVIDAIGQVAIPHLQALRVKERRIDEFERVAHELENPLVGIRGAVEHIQRAVRKAGLSPETAFGNDYLSDIWSWTDLMQRHIKNAEHLRAGTLKPDRSRPTLLLADVLAAVVRQVALLLRARTFPSGRIEYRGFDQIPPLYVDRNLFQQVAFNLLANSIKYAYKDPGAFNIMIEADRLRSGFRVYFRDTGIGIDAGMEEAIFEEGFRAPGVATSRVKGSGLGLWIVRRIIDAHGGEIRVTNNSQPTEFTITLPESLARYDGANGPARRT